MFFFFFKWNWSFFLLSAEMKAGQKAGVSYERYAKQSVVCQDAPRMLGHWLCPRVIYYPSQWAHSCLTWPFHRALQSLCVHSASPSPIPALPHPVCILISTESSDHLYARYNICSAPNGTSRRLRNPCRQYAFSFIIIRSSAASAW